jgi:hypothetical protein
VPVEEAAVAPAARAMADTLISVAWARARSSAVMTRWRRRADSACRPSIIAWVGVLVAVVVLMRWPPRWAWSGVRRAG